MVFLNVLYQIFIAPIEIFLEWSLIRTYDLTGSYGISIILLSLIVNILLLPLYNMAEAWQEEERLIQDKMAGKLETIKAVFKGQEKFMILQTLYRQNNYHPMMAARNSVGFLIQIPFFFAAYHLLLNYSDLNGQSFIIFKNLGTPDGLLSLFGFEINILPFIMTVVNLVSAYVYTSKLSFRDKIQLYVFALFFLIVLYNSPSGLVLYWTFNNIFSLIKNWIYEKIDMFKKVEVEELNTQSDSIKSLRFFDYKIFLNVSLTALALGVYAHILYEVIFPSGINRNVSYEFRNIFLNVFWISLIFHFIFRNKLKNKFPQTHYSQPSLGFKDGLLLILPLAPLLHYVYLNDSFIDFSSIYSYLTLTLGIITVVALVGSKLTERFISSSYVFISVVIFSFIFAIMPKLVGYFSWSGSGSLGIQVSLFLVLLVGVFFLFTYKRALLYILLFTYLSTETYTGLTSEPQDMTVASNTKTRDVSDDKSLLEYKNLEFKKKVPVILLTYDAYPNHETHELHGISNSDQMEFLKNNNFSIYNGTYSTIVNTVPALSSLMAIGYPKSVMDQKMNILGYSFSHDVFRNNGYKVHGIYESTYYMSDFTPKLDVVYPSALISNDGFLHSLKRGVLDDQVAFDQPLHRFFAEKKREYLRSNELQFIQSHENKPSHAAFKGYCSTGYFERYLKNLSDANMEMKLDVEEAVKRNPHAIIIVAGDHGPYLTKNCRGTGLDGISKAEINRLDVQSRYGALLAIRWPESGVAEKFNMHTVQDVMPAIFSYLADDYSLFDKLKLPSETFPDDSITSGVMIKGNTLDGGVNDGEPLFFNRKIDTVY